MSAEEERRRSGRPSDLHRLLEEARGGTMFLDEIQEMSMDQQQYLYSALEGAPQGGGSPRSLRDVRIICGASRSLRNQVAAGRFMENLYYRLNVIHVDVKPPQMYS
jgi:DNA-binding NtrC family response regulator